MKFFILNPETLPLTVWGMWRPPFRMASLKFHLDEARVVFVIFWLGKNRDPAKNKTETEFLACQTHGIHVQYVYLNLAKIYGKCR